MITKIIHEEKIQKAKKYVEKGESFVIVTHVTPDGDAIGSALGLYNSINGCQDIKKSSFMRNILILPNS